MNFLTKQLEARQSDRDALIKRAEEVNDVEELRTLQTQIDEVDEEIREINELIARESEPTEEAEPEAPAEEEAEEEGGADDGLDEGRSNDPRFIENRNTVPEGMRIMGGGNAPAQEERTMDNVFSTPLYRSAFLKDLMGHELTAEEREAYVHNTTNTSAVIPTTMIDQIWNLISTTHSLLNDVTVYRTGTVIEVVKHTAIVQGDAANVNEGAANDDEKNTFVKVTLSGKDFSKHIDITYALDAMAIDAFESYLVNEIASRLGKALCDDIYAQIGTDMTSDNKVDTASVDEIAWTDLTNAFSLIERADDIVIYAKRSTVYKYIAGMVDDANRPIFNPLNGEKGIIGSVLGAPIKIDDSVADKKVLIGDAKKVVTNMVQDIMIESDKDIKKHVKTYSGYCRAESALIVPTAFALLSVKNS